MHQFQELWDKLAVGMIALRDVFDGASPALSCFDEFLAANEYELALGSLCRFVLENRNVIITTDLVNRISELNTLMGINSSFGEELELKRKLHR